MLSAEFNLPFLVYFLFFVVYFWLFLHLFYLVVFLAGPLSASLLNLYSLWGKWLEVLREGKKIYLFPQFFLAVPFLVALLIRAVCLLVCLFIWLACFGCVGANFSSQGLWWQNSQATILSLLFLCSAAAVWLTTGLSWQLGRAKKVGGTRAGAFSLFRQTVLPTYIIHDIHDFLHWNPQDALFNNPILIY